MNLTIRFNHFLAAHGSGVAELGPVRQGFLLNLCNLFDLFPAWQGGVWLREAGPVKARTFGVLLISILAARLGEPWPG